MKITSVRARYILDSRGFPTVEADIRTDSGAIGRAAVPSGVSTGSYEAVELRDGGTAYGGKGVEKAVEAINSIIAPVVIGMEAWDQFALDEALKKLDGTTNKGNLGANAMLAVSLAVAKSAAMSNGIPLWRHIAEMSGTTTPSLPMPMMNILNGGKHASGSTDTQEFMIVPIGAEDIHRALRMGAEVFHALHKVLTEKNYGTTVGDEGGFSPALVHGSAEALQLIELAVKKAGYSWGQDIAVALDVAASELYDGSRYIFKREGRDYSSEELVQTYTQLIGRHPIVSLEDGMDENDWTGWQTLTASIGEKVQIVGDDLLVTSTERLARAIEHKAGNAILIKPNQIGTLTETIQAVTVAQDAGWRTVMSHRSGETEDVTIAHLAVGLNCGQIKTGSLSRSERLAKYNELLRISEQLGSTQLQNPFM